MLRNLKQLTIPVLKLPCLRYVLMNNLKESICVDSRKGAPLNLAPGSSGVVYRFDGVPRSGLRGKVRFHHFQPLWC
jgi:hypothetical protein